MEQTVLLAPEQILQLVESVWVGMVGLPIVPEEPAEPIDDAPDAKCLTACVQITGAWRGTVLFEPSLPAARRAASLMLATPPSELRASDLHDAVAELCNIIGGGIKSLLPGPSSLSLPMVLHGSQFGFRIPFTAVVLEMKFVSDGQPLAIRVLEEVEPHASRQASG